MDTWPRSLDFIQRSLESQGRVVNKEMFTFLLWDPEDDLSCQALRMLFLQPGAHFLLPLPCLVPNPPFHRQLAIPFSRKSSLTLRPPGRVEKLLWSPLAPWNFPHVGSDHSACDPPTQLWLLWTVAVQSAPASSMVSSMPNDKKCSGTEQMSGVPCLPHVLPAPTRASLTAVGL